MDNKFRALAMRLREASAPDRRLDSEVTLLVFGPAGSALDELPGIDGWDIAAPADDGDMEIWQAADEVLYATQFVDSAIELCVAAAPQAAPAVIVRALAGVLRRNATAADGAEVAGYIARSILGELLEELSLEPARVAKAA